MASPVPKDAMEFPPLDRVSLEPHLPPRDGSIRYPNLPFTTLTFATSTVEIAASDIGEHHLDWNLLLVSLKENVLKSVMVEGGGQVINFLLSPQYQPIIDMVIVTAAPTWLGQGGVVVSPRGCFNDAGIAIQAARLTGVKWYPFGEDVVLCGRMNL